MWCLSTSTLQLPTLFAPLATRTSASKNQNLSPERRDERRRGARPQQARHVLDAQRVHAVRHLVHRDFRVMLCFSKGDTMCSLISAFAKSKTLLVLQGKNRERIEFDVFEVSFSFLFAKHPLPARPRGPGSSPRCTWSCWGRTRRLCSKWSPLPRLPRPSPARRVLHKQL